MRTLLATPVEYPFTIVPMGGAVISAVLQSRGFWAHSLVEPVYLQGSAYTLVTPEKEKKARLEKVEELAQKILFFEPDVVGFSCFVSNRKSVSHLARLLKKQKPGLILVAGGPDIHPAQGEPSGIDELKNLVDYLVQGDGEHKALRLWEALGKDGVHPGDAGIWPGGRIPKDLLAGHRDRVGNPDEWPIPDFGDNPHFERFQDQNGYFAGIPVSFSRGCTGNCSFCGRDEYYKGLVCRGAKSVFHEIAAQTRRYGLDRFVIVDDDPLARPCLGEFMNLARMLIQHPGRLGGTIYNARLTPSLADPKIPRLLKRAGFDSIQFGVESFSPAVRRHMGKPGKQETVDRVLKNFYSAGIRPGVYLIYGYPTETEADFQTTLGWLHKNHRRLASVNANPFFNNEAFRRKRPDDYSYTTPPPGQPLCFWKSEQVNPEILWLRHAQMLQFMKDRFTGHWSVADPNGDYESGP